MLTASEAAKWLSAATQCPKLLLIPHGFFIRHAWFPVGLLAIVSLSAKAQALPTNAVEVLVIQGTAEVARAGQSVWDLASTQKPYCRLNPGDQIRTKERSRATVRLSDLTIIELGANAHLQVLQAEVPRPGFSLLRGLLHLFHRDKPGEFYFRTPTASPVIRGTEFNLEVTEDGSTTLHLLEGEVALTNELGQLDLKTGEASAVQAGRAPRRIAALEAVNVIQWCLYYPAVLHLDELRLNPEEASALTNSLAAYRRGDLLVALGAYPLARRPASDEERVYLAALLLAVGEVSQAEALLNSLSGTDETATRLATAIRTLISAVKFQARPAAEQTPANVPLASSLLAESYYHQSRFELEAALGSARSAVELAPEFAFGWARVAELEFSFGRTHRALEAAERAQALAPRNAEAMAVKGFLLAAQNHFDSALAQFDEAIAIDGALGNAWLGRGLCKIRRSGLAALGTRYSTLDTSSLADLLVAAALEPNRALLRSYLGKGFSYADDARARHELELAKQLDPNDPTAWLYLALLNQQENRINDAVRDLERSEELNDNRQLYRSRLLLDQDRAVRQANLAAVYQDAGLFDQSVREAARAVGSDYANYSAHLFLANSYAQQRDPNSSSLRYETVALSEYLISQLLSPVGGSCLSPYVSQQEYSRLFDRQGFGISSGTQYSSRGDWQQHGVQYGSFANFDYSFDAYYASQNGQRINNDFTLRSFAPAAKVQVGPQDTLFFQAVSTEFESGDLRQYYDPTAADRGLRVKESQEPNLFFGYHREWAPGSHSLLLFGRLDDDFRLSEQAIFIPTFRRDFTGIFDVLFPGFSQFSERQRAQFTAYSAEVQQIWQCANNTLIFGGRYQDGQTHSDIELAKLPPSFGNLAYPQGTNHTETQLRRRVVYAYDNLQVRDGLWLIGGLTYDWLSYPQNIDLPPITGTQRHKDQISPKAGVIWDPATNIVVRGAYTRSLGGLYYDNSVRLEPSQVAGFNQAFRSLIPESVAGLVAGSEFETADLDLSVRLPTGTYLGVGHEWLWSDATRTDPVFVSSIFSSAVTSSNTQQRLKFREESLITANVNQLIGRDWSLSVRYRLTRDHLDQHLLLAVPADLASSVITTDSALLHELNLSARFAHPSGFFAEAQALWYLQDSQNNPDSDFWQFNVFAGYRFAKRRAEVLVGGLNLSDQDYRLDPINLYLELPRTRTLLLSLKFNF